MMLVNNKLNQAIFSGKVTSRAVIFKFKSGSDMIPDSAIRFQSFRTRIRNIGIRTSPTGFEPGKF